MAQTEQETEKLQNLTRSYECGARKFPLVYLPLLLSIVLVAYLALGIEGMTMPWKLLALGWFAVILLCCSLAIDTAWRTESNLRLALMLSKKFGLEIAPLTEKENSALKRLVEYYARGLSKSPVLYLRLYIGFVFATVLVFSVVTMSLPTWKGWGWLAIFSLCVGLAVKTASNVQSNLTSTLKVIGKQQATTGHLGNG